MSRRPPVAATIERRDDHLLVRWTAGEAAGSCRFDHLPGTDPEWLGAAEELLEGTDRRSEARVLEAVAGAARQEGLELGIWHDGQGVERLT